MFEELAIVEAVRACVAFLHFRGVARGIEGDRCLHFYVKAIERVVVYKLDRLGRSLTHMALIIEEMARLNVPLICTSQGIDTSGDSPVGKLQLGVLMAVAEFERDIIRERTVAGLEAARERGVTLGRPPTLKRRQAEVMKLKADGVGIREIGRRLKMAPSSVHSVLSRT
jgi:DNA invertase Pin-like site-specific DNA recombinase